MVKIPKILSPVPAPKFGDFRGFSPESPQNFSFPRPQSIPEPIKSSNPVPIPKKWGILGINPPKIPRICVVPIRKVSPTFFKSLSTSPTDIFGDGENWVFLGQVDMFQKKYLYFGHHVTIYRVCDPYFLVIFQSKRQNGDFWRIPEI